MNVFRAPRTRERRKVYGGKEDSKEETGKEETCKEEDCGKEETCKEDCGKEETCKEEKIKLLSRNN